MLSMNGRNSLSIPCLTSEYFGHAPTSRQIPVIPIGAVVVFRINADSITVEDLGTERLARGVGSVDHAVLDDVPIISSGMNVFLIDPQSTDSEAFRAR